MQPYLFPYLGYFQLIKNVDIFGIGDDVQYIKSGWINRNRILSNGEPYMFTFPVKKDSSFKIIKERYFDESFSSYKDKFLRVLDHSYKKAPFYNETLKLLEEIFSNNESNVSKFIENHLKIICKHINISTPFLSSSDWTIDHQDDFSVEERVIKKLEKLKRIGITHFINPIGGNELYTKEFFEKSGVKLSFLECTDIPYKQFDYEFIPKLSIIDVLMFNSVDEIQGLLNCFNLK